MNELIMGKKEDLKKDSKVGRLTRDNYKKGQ